MKIPAPRLKLLNNTNLNLQIATNKKSIFPRDFSLRETLALISGEAVLSVGEARHDVTGAAEALLQRHLPRGRHHLRRVVAVRTHRQDHGGDKGTRILQDS